MIYGFAYLGMVLAISAGWILLAVLKKPDFIEKPLSELKNKIRPFQIQKKLNEICSDFIFINWIYLKN